MGNATPGIVNEMQSDPRLVAHWYDFICPFCYVGQQRNAILISNGFRVLELPFQAHPEIPRGGIPAGPRTGAMYVRLEQEARDAGLPLHWPRRLPNTRRALAAAEWARRHQPHAFRQLHEALFNAHFVLCEDLEDPGVIERHARESGVDLAALQAALAGDDSMTAVTLAETVARQCGVHGTPAWLLPDRRLVMGLRPAAEFESLAKEAVR